MPRFVIAVLLWVVLIGAVTAVLYQPVARQEARIHQAAAAGDDAVVIVEAEDYLSRNACLPGASRVAGAYHAALLRAGRTTEAAAFRQRRPELAAALP